MSFPARLKYSKSTLFFVRKEMKYSMPISEIELLSKFIKVRFQNHLVSFNFSKKVSLIQDSSKNSLFISREFLYIKVTRSS